MTALPETPFNVGDWVESVAVGDVPKFVGQVIRVVGNDLVIRDAQNRRWAREYVEVRPAPRPG